MQKNKKVSVILPNYNYASYITRRVNEIMNQSYPVSEIIFLDDASNDNSVDKIKAEIKLLKKAFPDLVIKYKFNDNNSGNVFSQWQAGIKLATMDYIWICELDDVAKTDFLKTVMAGFNDKDVVLSYCSSRSIDSNNKIVLKDQFRNFKNIFRRHHLSKDYTVDGIEEINRNLAVFNSIPNVSAVVFKNQPNLVNYLEQAKHFKLCGDWYFYLEVAKTGKISYCHQVLNYHRIHNQSVTNSTDLGQRFSEMQKIHKHVLESMDLEPATKKRIAKIESNLAKKWHL